MSPGVAAQDLSPANLVKEHFLHSLSDQGKLRPLPTAVPLR